MLLDVKLNSIKTCAFLTRGLRRGALGLPLERWTKFRPLTRQGKMNSFRAVRYVAAKVYVAIWAVVAVVLLAGAFACVAPALGNDAGAEGAADGWRRTANGWELVSRWHDQPPVQYSVESAIRLDGHPAALALLQSLAVVGAFALFPPSRFTRSRAMA
jgi:hypothetical protein